VNTDADAFHWTTFDVVGLLPAGWQNEVIRVAREADTREFPRTPGLTREGADVESILRGRVHAAQVQERMPWLCSLYHGAFRDLAERACHERVWTAHDARYGVVLNVQDGPDMRFENHVDSNPVSGVLFFTDHAAGGELVFARDRTASDVASVERDSIAIEPHAGYLVFFDGRRPHYARPLKVQSEIRVVAAMNFYIKSFPESTRPSGLNHHLFGDPG
jgi:hypothetical protein